MVTLAPLQQLPPLEKKQMSQPPNLSSLSLAQDSSPLKVLEKANYRVLDSFEIRTVPVPGSSIKSNVSILLRVIAPSGVTVFIDMRVDGKESVLAGMDNKMHRQTVLVPTSDVKEGFVDHYRMSLEKCLGYSVCGLAYICLDKFCYLPTLVDRREEYFTFDGQSVHLEDSVLTYPVIEYSFVQSDPRGASEAAFETMVQLRKLELHMDLDELNEFKNSVEQLSSVSSEVASIYKERLSEIFETMEHLEEFYFRIASKSSLTVMESKQLDAAIIEISQRDKMLLELLAQTRSLLQLRRRVEEALAEFKKALHMLKTNYAEFKFSKT